MAAILAADLEGYSAREARDEETVVGQVRALLSELVAPAVAAAGGRVALVRLVARHPGLTVKRIHDSMPPSAMVHHPTFLDGLRRAGLPDE